MKWTHTRSILRRNIFPSKLPFIILFVEIYSSLIPPKFTNLTMAEGMKTTCPEGFVMIPKNMILHLFPTILLCYIRAKKIYQQTVSVRYIIYLQEIHLNLPCISQIPTSKCLIEELVWRCRRMILGVKGNQRELMSDNQLHKIYSYIKQGNLLSCSSCSSAVCVTIRLTPSGF